MKYCPGCTTNFDIKQNFCPNCRTILIDFLNGKQGAFTPDNSWIAIGGVKDDVNSEVAKGSLDSNNIPSVFLNNSSLKQDDDLMETEEPIDENIIMVPREFKAEALMILSGILGNKLIKLDSNSNFM